MKKHEQAFEVFKASDGRLTNAEIATEVEAAESTVRKWKSRYKWLEQLGLTENVTPSKKKSVTKKEPDLREEHKVRTIEAMNEAGTYSPAFDLLIELYLDAYVEYVESRKNGTAEERQRKELTRMLKQLGLDITNKVLVKNSGVVVKGAEKDNKPALKGEEPKPISQLDDFRNRRKRGS